MAYEQEIDHIKAEEHAALVARLQAGESLPPELRIPAAQSVIEDESDGPLVERARS